MSRAECRHVSEVIKKDTAEDKVHYLEVDKMLKTLLGKKARITAVVAEAKPDLPPNKPTSIFSNAAQAPTQIV